MEYRQLGRSGLQVSVISIGTNQFGSPVDAEGTKAILDAGLESGINFIDTADGYGGGMSEQYIGRAIKDKRYEWAIMSKFGNYPMGEGPNKRGNSRGYMRKAVVGSLQRLDTDYIDVYLFHRPDPNTPIEEQMSGMNDLVREGIVRYIGCSNWAGWQVAEANETAKRYGWEPFVASQPAYSLMNRAPEGEHIQACLRYGLGLTAFTPLQGGFLTGKHKRGQAPVAGTRIERNPRATQTVLTDPNFDKLEAWEAIADQTGITMTQLAIGWVAAQPVVSSVICGATNADQVRENAAVSDVVPKITPDVLKAVDEASGLGRPAGRGG
jgi:aryl-alcohol dehydrogenase-like predicted oxidoreductase